MTSSLLNFWKRSLRLMKRRRTESERGLHHQRGFVSALGSGSEIVMRRARKRLIIGVCFAAIQCSWRSDQVFSSTQNFPGIVLAVGGGETSESHVSPLCRFWKFENGAESSEHKEEHFFLLEKHYGRCIIEKERSLRSEKSLYPSMLASK